MLQCIVSFLVQVALQGLKNILFAGATLKEIPGNTNTNPYAVLVEDAGGLDSLETLQDHQSEDISSKAIEILSSYFEAASDNEEDSFVPSLPPQGLYAFPAAERDMPLSQPEGTFDFNVV
jgi:importin subunit alpha-6/7